MTTAKKARTGLLPEHDAVALPIYTDLRLTIPAREALERADNRVTRSDTPHGPLYSVELARPARGLVLCYVRAMWVDVPADVPPSMRAQIPEALRALRRIDEPPYPGEVSDVIAWHEHGQWVPCPTCGASLVWYEAAYVPGYRVCSAAPHHHAMLSADGQTAEAQWR